MEEFGLIALAAVIIIVLGILAGIDILATGGENLKSILG